MGWAEGSILWKMVHPRLFEVDRASANCFEVQSSVCCFSALDFVGFVRDWRLGFEDSGFQILVSEQYRAREGDRIDNF